MSDVALHYQTIVYQSLRNLSMSNALFYAERLVYSFPDSSICNLVMAFTLFSNQEYNRCLVYSCKSNDSRSKFLSAQSFYQLQKYSECEQICLKLLASWREEITDIIPLISELEIMLPSKFRLEYVYELLGNVYKKMGKRSLTIKNFTESLQLNTFLWSSFEILCDFGEFLDLNILFDEPIKSKLEEDSICAKRGNVKNEPAAKRRSTRVNPSKPSKENAKIDSALYKGKENYSQDYKTFSDIAKLLKIISSGIIALSRYESKKAIEILLKIPSNQFHSPYILGKTAIAAFEDGNYKLSEKYFQEIRSVDNSYFQGFEFYSSVLWHLKKEKELSNLAKECLALTRKDATIWCIAGNSFSLLKQHINAIKCFKRCLQIDSTFHYAFTLLGHENIITENFDQSIEFFKNAISLKYRHYNAWYGLGVIYLRQEKYDLSEYYFKKAIDINPNNAILSCNLGIVYNHQKKLIEADEAFNLAVKLDIKNPFIRFQRSKFLYQSNRFQEALKDLRTIVDTVSNEPSIYILMGKTLKALGFEDQSLRSFSLAKEFSTKTPIDIASVSKDSGLEAEVMKTP